MALNKIIYFGNLAIKCGWYVIRCKMIKEGFNHGDIGKVLVYVLESQKAH